MYSSVIVLGKNRKNNREKANSKLEMKIYSYDSDESKLTGNLQRLRTDLKS